MNKSYVKLEDEGVEIASVPIGNTTQKRTLGKVNPDHQCCVVEKFC